MRYSFTTYNVFKLQLPFSRQNVGKLVKKNNFLILQEWVESLNVNDEVSMETFPTFTLPLKRQKTGTATISDTPLLDQKKILSKSKELGFLTPKSMLVTSYDVKGKILTIVNIHELNFVTNSSWYKTIDHWLEHIPHTGPLILAGDFNTWNPWRFNYLEEKLKRRGLLYGHYDYNLIMRLDHIWYRDIEKISCEMDRNMHSSDHYPVTMVFEM